MVAVLSNISNIIIPVIIFYVVAYGLAARSNVYEDFIKGAKDGFYTVIQIMPTLIGLMVAVGVLRASGFLDFVGGLFSGAAARMDRKTALLDGVLFFRAVLSAVSCSVFLLCRTFAKPASPPE